MYVLALAAALLALAGCTAQTPNTAGRPPPSVTTKATVPRAAHVVVVVVVVVEENHSYADIIGNASAPYINWLASHGALMTSSYAVTHPSEPNYLALFVGSTFGLTSDACPVSESAAPNLASELIANRDTFRAYAEDLPSPGAQTCGAGEYARKHAPWVNFSNAPAADPFTAFPADYAALPTVSFVIPNLINDMHDGTIAQGDSWLKTHLSSYVTWARSHDSLLVLTWDEDDHSQNNQIPTIIVGQPDGAAGIRPGRYNETISHYNILATIEKMYGLPAIGHTAGALTDIWSR
jgi:acid phosphatase